MSFESSDIKMLEKFQCELQWVRTIKKKKLNDSKLRRFEKVETTNVQNVPN